MHHHKWSLEHLDNLIPYEKELYLSMLIEFLKEEERKMKERQAANNG